MCKLRIAQYFRCICIRVKPNLLFWYSVCWTAHFASIWNHSMTDWGLKGLLEVSWSNPFAQMGSPRASCPGPRPEGFWISPKMEALLPPWAVCTSAQWHHREKMSTFRWTPAFQSALTASVLTPGTTEKSLSSLQPSFRCLYTWMSLVLPRTESPSSHSLSLYETCCCHGHLCGP